MTPLKSKKAKAKGPTSSPPAAAAKGKGGSEPTPNDSCSKSQASTLKKPTKPPEKSILNDVQIARAKDVIESQPKQLHSLLVETALNLLSKNELITSKQTGNLKLQHDESIIPRSICFKAELDFPDKFKNDPTTIENKTKFNATMKSFQTTLWTLIVEQNNQTITLLSEDRLKLFVEKLQAIAHGLTCYHDNLESIDLAGCSFEAAAAAALHCYYSDLH
jgi:hypothetical protein